MRRFKLQAKERIQPYEPWTWYVYLHKNLLEAYELNAAEFEKLTQHFDTAYPWAFMTAFRDIYDHDENLSRNQKLAGDITALGYSFIEVSGEYIEGDSGKVLKEITFFVRGDKPVGEYSTNHKAGKILTLDKLAWKRFNTNMVRLGEKYDQWAIITGHLTQKGNSTQDNRYYAKVINFPNIDPVTDEVIEPEKALEIYKEIRIADANDINKLISKRKYKGHTRIEDDMFVLAGAFRVKKLVSVIAMLGGNWPIKWAQQNYKWGLWNGTHYTAKD
jgi:hypothetical protein